MAKATKSSKSAQKKRASGSARPASKPTKFKAHVKVTAKPKTASKPAAKPKVGAKAKSPAPVAKKAAPTPTPPRQAASKPMASARPISSSSPKSDRPIVTRVAPPVDERSAGPEGTPPALPVPIASFTF
jgi:hypothetical protein